MPKFKKGDIIEICWYDNPKNIEFAEVTSRGKLIKDPVYWLDILSGERAGKFSAWEVDRIDKWSTKINKKLYNLLYK